MKATTLIDTLADPVIPYRTKVNEVFSSCNDQNRAAVETELKGLIFQAYEKKELWKIDWANVQLER